MDRLGKDRTVKDDMWVSDSDLCGRMNGGTLYWTGDTERGPQLAPMGEGRRGEFGFVHVVFTWEWGNAVVPQEPVPTSPLSVWVPGPGEPRTLPP